MTVLDQAFLLDNLPAILGADVKYVVPRQGTWWNPQDVGEEPTKPNNWCAFALEDVRGLTLAHFVADATPANWSVQHDIATLALQFVGPKGMTNATAVGHWTHRADVFRMFSLVDGSVMGGFAVSGSDFAQDGENTVRSYTARIKVLYASKIETGQTPTGPGTDWAGMRIGGEAD